MFTFALPSISSAQEVPLTGLLAPPITTPTASEPVMETKPLETTPKNTELEPIDLERKLKEVEAEPTPDPVKKASEFENSLEQMNTTLTAELNALREAYNLLKEAFADQKEKITSIETKLNGVLAKLLPPKPTAPTTTNPTDKAIEGGLLVEATAYTAYCKGCTGFTKTGIDVRYRTPNVIAVDPRVIPLGTKVDIYDPVSKKYMGRYLAADIGSAIKGNKIDILMKGYQTAMNFGRRQMVVKIVKG